LSSTTVAQRLLDSRDDDTTAITFSNAPVAMEAQLQAPDVPRRVTRPDSGVVDVLLPNVSAPAMANATVRRAFAMATDRQRYSEAEASPMTPTSSVLGRAVPGRSAGGAAEASPTGNPGAARALLAGAGVGTPIPLRVGYAPSEAANRALAALLPSWDEAGFAVTLVPRSTGSQVVDVELGQVYAAYPGGGAVLPSLVQRLSEPGLSATVAAAEAINDLPARNRAWGELDVTLTAAGDVVPLAERQRLLLRGTGVEAYQDNVLLGGLPDLASIVVND
jgi:peptide/nickel transport system substrate-binding protein